MRRLSVKKLFGGLPFDLSTEKLTFVSGQYLCEMKKPAHIFDGKLFDCSFLVWQYAESKGIKIASIDKYQMKGTQVYCYKAESKNACLKDKH